MTQLFAALFLAGAPQPLAAHAAAGATPPPAGAVINVLDHGAKGDGKADDTRAIRSALAAAGRAPIAAWDWGQGQGGVVYLPRGVYRVTDTIRWTTDATFLVGESKHTTAILLDLRDPAKDGIVVGKPPHNARRSGLRDLSIYSEGTATVRDALVIDETTWWRLENVDITRAGRHGLHVYGSYDGVAINVRTGYCGDSGVVIERAPSSGTATTVTSFFDLYTLQNRRHGVLLRSGHPTNFYHLTSEYNGTGGDPTQGDGLRLDAGTTEGDGAEANLFGAYFESNRGWDVQAGLGTALGGGRHTLAAYGVRATPLGAAPKAAGYGFYRGLARSAAAFHAPFLTGYAAGKHGTFRWEDGAELSIHAAPLWDWPASNPPEYYARGVRRPLDEGRGVLEIRGPDGELTVRGRHAMPARGGGQSFSGNRGDASVTLSVASDQPVQLFDAPLTADRTVTLGTMGCSGGERFRIVRTVAATGGATLTVRSVPSKALSAGQWAEVAFDAANGSVWRLIAAGSL
jgi:hypothetical protein